MVIQLYEQPSGCLVETIGEKIVPISIEIASDGTSVTDLGSDWAMMHQLAVSSVPAYYLVGPDGKLVMSSSQWKEADIDQDGFVTVEELGRSLESQSPQR